MRGLALAASLVALFSTALGGDLAARNAVEFRSVRSSYRIGEPITFVVVSKARRKIWFSCTPEAQADGRWYELDYSIDTGMNFKAVPLRLLAAGHQQTVIWKPRHLPSGRPLIVRLKAGIYADPAGERIQDVFSVRFSIH